MSTSVSPVRTDVSTRATTVRAATCVPVALVTLSAQRIESVALVSVCLQTQLWTFIQKAI